MIDSEETASVTEGSNQTVALDQGTILIIVSNIFTKQIITYSDLEEGELSATITMSVSLQLRPESHTTPTSE